MNLPCETEMVITLENPFKNRTQMDNGNHLMDNGNHLMDKDLQFIHMQQLIKQKRNMLLEKQRHLQKAVKQNEFLEMVKKDYNKYNDYIFQQKREQIQALETLKNYVEDLNKTNQMSKYNMQDARVEQKKIMNEIESIRKGLAEIISNTNKL
jgi:hypothetical protein